MTDNKQQTTNNKYRIGTSGYSFPDWVGTFYPPTTRSVDMFDRYVEHFNTVELNFTYYRVPSAGTMQKLARVSPEGFAFWVKANQEITHKHNRSASREFIDNLQPLTDSLKLAGVLFQFPQGFHRTTANRRYLAAALEDFAPLPTAVEFRHRSWDHPLTLRSLRERSVTLVVPDVPALPDLYSVPAAATTATGYLRLHSRNARNWYAGEKDRYDYGYSEQEMRELLREWEALAGQVDRVYVYFNNCHAGQAARNAEAFGRLLEGL
ncbi:MAG: hypothetical protein BWX88_01444 [Planctomycetes bacterium ADurb.Bin126]|nr:MAG: hypothetical protein BWX88_01444 [Planctomycetes bacterium ADurb.Bin126]HOD80570.1 DUF72 domain-containing protein [Phycisphaerae bacterium]HQL72411.1 DUF72 domain-containing protein [Phycisphaerae bacterium]